MKKNKKNRINVVYSTNPDFQFEEESNGVEETLIPSEQSLYISLDKKNTSIYVSKLRSTLYRSAAE